MKEKHMDKSKIDELKSLCATNYVSHRGMDGKTLRELRDKLGLTQDELGTKLGITKDAVSKLERGINTMSKPVAILALQLAHSRD